MSQKGSDSDSSRVWIYISIPKCPKLKEKMEHFDFGMHAHARDLSLSQPFWDILTTLP